MRFSMILAGVLAPLAFAGALQAQVMRGVGEPMKFDIGYGIEVNEDSTLSREWVIVNDPRLPVSLTSFVAKTRYEDRNWIYDVDYSIDAAEEIQAIEVRFLPFDIWGGSSRSLSATDIQDVAVGTSSFNAQWRLRSETAATQHYAMLGYVAQVKLTSGAILRANTDAVVGEARRFSDDFTSGDLSVDD